MNVDLWMRLDEVLIALENGAIQAMDILAEYGEDIYNYIMGLG